MKILVIHDRPDVTEQIIELLEKLEIERRDIETADDYYSARKVLSTTIFDIAIVDLTIPKKMGEGDAEYENVSDLLRELFYFREHNPPGDIIGITLDQSVLQRISTDLGQHLMVVIEEDSDGNWRQHLTDKIEYAKRASETRFVSINQHYATDVLILSAMDHEMAPFRRDFECHDVDYYPGASAFIFQDRHGKTRNGVCFSVGRSGQASAASFAQSLISTFRPKLSLMPGYCGGVEGKVELGDLIVFEAAYAWDYGKWYEAGSDGNTEAEFRPRPNPVGISEDLVHSIARKIIGSDFNRQPVLLDNVDKISRGMLTGFKMHLAPAASGSAVVADTEVSSRIVGLNDSIRAIDMESYGFYFAAKNTQVVKPQALCVKAVSDFSNGEKEDRYQEVCCEISAAFLCKLIKEFWDF